MSKKRSIEGSTETFKRFKEVEAGELNDRTEDQPNADDTGLKDILGFESFGTTKNSHVLDNSTTAARGGRAPRQTRKARQILHLKKNKGKEKRETANTEIDESN